MDKKLKVKIISILTALAGFAILAIAGMNLFQLLMNSVTSMSMSSTGIVEIPTINDFFMQFIDRTAVLEIVVGAILLVAGGIGYMWYPMMDIKNQLSNVFRKEIKS
jgi:hypothetical protein